jgi:hypothetical protein
VADTYSIKVNLSGCRWRVLVARAWVWALVLFGKTLPGSVDVDFESERIRNFICRGVKKKAIQ